MDLIISGLFLNRFIVNIRGDSKTAVGKIPIAVAYSQPRHNEKRKNLKKDKFSDMFRSLGKEIIVWDAWDFKYKIWRSSVTMFEGRVTR